MDGNYVGGCSPTCPAPTVSDTLNNIENRMDTLREVASTINIRLLGDRPSKEQKKEGINPCVGVLDRTERVVHDLDSVIASLGESLSRI